MDEEILEIDSEDTPVISETPYHILDENGNEIENPDLSLGHLEREELIEYHNGVPEQGHYYVSFIELTNGERIFFKENDPRIEITDPKKGTFKYLPAQDDPSIKIKGATVRYVIDQRKIDPYETKETILRYILYTEEELSNRIFLAEGPERLDNVETDTSDLLEVVADLAGSDIEERVQDAQETLDDLLLVIADILGGVEE